MMIKNKVVISTKKGEWLKVVKRGAKLKDSESLRVDHQRELWREASKKYYNAHRKEISKRNNENSKKYYNQHKDEILTKRKDEKW